MDWINEVKELNNLDKETLEKIGVFLIQIAQDKNSSSSILCKNYKRNTVINAPKPPSEAKPIPQTTPRKPLKIYGV